MNEQSVTLAVVGCGAVASKYYAPAIGDSRLTDESLVFVDTDLDRAEELAAGFDGARATTSYEEVLGRVDGAIVAVPHALHYPIASAFLESGTTVLVEKPLAETREHAERLVALADDHDAALAVNNTRRLFPSVRAVKGALEAGTIGDLREVRIEEGLTFNWEAASSFRFVNTDRGVLADIGAHVLDLLCYWLDERPTLETYRDDSRGGIEATASVTVRSSDGVRGSVVLDWLSPRSNRYELRGTDGTLSFDAYGWDSLTLSSGERTETIRLPGSERTFGGFVAAIFEDFLDVLEKGASPAVPATAVVDSIGLIEECYESRQSYAMPWLEPKPVRSDSSS